MAFSNFRSPRKYKFATDRHKVRLIPPQYVRPFVKTNKNDAADAEAIYEAVARPTMRFAPAKSAEQQSVLMLHRARGHCQTKNLAIFQSPSGC